MLDKLYIHKIVLKRPTNALGFMNIILLQDKSPTCFGHRCGHLQDDEKKNTNTIIMCRNHSKVKNYAIFG